MHHGVERLRCGTELLQAHLGQCALKALAYGLERTLEFAMLTCSLDVIENRQEFGHDRTDCHLLDEVAIAIDALAVVRVFGVHPLQVVREFSDLHLDLGYF